MDKKHHFIASFIFVALKDGIQYLMDREDPDINPHYIFSHQAKKSLQRYASHMFDLLDKEYNLSERYRHDLLTFGGDLFTAALYDPSYTFLDNEAGLELLHGNRLDIYYYVDNNVFEEIGIVFNTY